MAQQRRAILAEVGREEGAAHPRTSGWTPTARGRAACGAAKSRSSSLQVALGDEGEGALGALIVATQQAALPHDLAHDLPHDLRRMRARLGPLTFF